MRSSGIQIYGGRLHLLSVAALGVLALALPLPSQSKATSGSRACDPARVLRLLGRLGPRLPTVRRSSRGDLSQRIGLRTKRRRRDATPPETTIASGPTGSTSANTASFGFNSSEAGSTFACRIDSGSWGSCGSPKDYPGLAAGDHQFSVRATDAAGNTDATPASRNWTVTAPEEPNRRRRLPRTSPLRRRRSPTAQLPPPPRPRPASPSPRTSPAPPLPASSTGEVGEGALRRSPTPR